MQLAPALSSNPDTNPDGTPVRITADPRGKYTPVIMVHGWVSRDTHTDDRDGTFSHVIDLTSNHIAGVHTTRSLIGQLQRIPGSAVFTFDYRDYAARWVDDAHLGPGLGKVIDCLYRASGEKVIVVGHSMGGLVTRYAATQPGINGTDRSSEISTVITFGTPETGSIAAMLSDLGATGAAVSNESLAILRLILAACGRLSSNEVRTGTLCDTLPPPVRTFDSDAGIALRYGSPQLAALKPWPKSVTVDALAGQASFQIPDAGWFALPWDTTSVGVGDLIVTGDSALSGTPHTRPVSCSYQLSAVRGATDSLGLLFRTVSKADVAQQPLAAFSGPCFHTQLMRGIELTNEATGEVNDDITSRQPIARSELLNAPVPSLCGHKPATLTNGKLATLPEREGYVVLKAGAEKLASSGLIALGDVNGDGRGDAAAVFSCNQGGVGWPDWIVFYTRGRSGLKVLGSYDMSNATGGARDGVEKISYADGAIHVSAIDGRKYDYGCCASGHATLDLRWNGKKIVTGDIKHLIGAGDVLFDGIGPVKLGMSASDLQRLGYTGGPGYLGCESFTKPGAVTATLDPRSGKVVAVSAGDLAHVQTYDGGITEGALLLFLREEFAGHQIDELLNNDFGQGSNGVIVHGAGGSIGFALEDSRPDLYAQGYASVTAIQVGIGMHASPNAEVGCT